MPQLPGGKNKFYSADAKQYVTVVVFNLYVLTGPQLSQDGWLNVMCDENLVTKLASKILHYQNIGYALGLPEADIIAIQNDNPNEELKRIAVVHKWIKKKGSDATYFALKEAFLSELVNDRETAEFIVDYAKERNGMKLSVCRPSMQAQSYPMADSQVTVSLVHAINGLDHPHGVAVANDGQVVVAESHGNCIKVIKEDGLILSSFIVGKCPRGVAVTQDNCILVAVEHEHKIYKMNFEGKVIAYVGCDQEGSEQTEFNSPYGVSVSPLTGLIYVADTYNNRVRVLNGNLQFLYDLSYNDARPKQLNFREPNDVAFDKNGFVYVTDTWNNCVKKFSPDGMFLDEFGDWGTGPGQLCFPEGIAIADNDLMYITEHSNYRVSIFTINGKFVHTIGKEGSGDDQFDWPRGIALDKARSLLYICDYINNRVVVYRIEDNTTQD